MATKGTVLVVDDDAGLVAYISNLLEQEGYEVRAAASGFQAKGLLARFLPDVLILDRRLPDCDGLELCKEIRKSTAQKALPILFLSGTKKSPTERVVGLRFGGDDYLTKPFLGEELLARVEALMRRTKKLQEEAGVLRFGSLEVDIDSRRVTIDGRALELSRKELDLLQAFLQHKGRVLTRQFLLENVWGYEQALHVMSKTVDVTVGHLRRKLGEHGKQIVAVQGYGYRFELGQ